MGRPSAPRLQRAVSGLRGLADRVALIDKHAQLRAPWSQPGRAGRLALEDLGVLVKFGADLEGVGVVEVLQDVEGLLPGVPGGGYVSGGAAGVAEAA